MNNPSWQPFLWRGLRPIVLRWGVMLALALLLVAAAMWARHQAAQAVESAHAALQGINAEEQEVHTQLDLVEQNLAAYRRWREVQLIDTQPTAQRRALWAQQLQAALHALGPWVEAAVVFKLEPPVQVTPQEAAIQEGTVGAQQDSLRQATASRHPLKLSIKGLHDLEALRVWQATQDALGDTAHAQGCDWRRQQDDLQVECDWQLYYVQLPVQVDPATRQP